MDKIDLRIDAKLEQALQGLIGKAPVPDRRFGLDAMPRHAIAGARHAKLGHEAKIVHATAHNGRSIRIRPESVRSRGAAR